MVGYLIWKLSSNFRDFTWPKFSGYNLLSLVLKDQKPFLSLTGRVPLTGCNIPHETTVCSSKGQALQFAYTVSTIFFSIQAWRLWMEYPSRWEDEAPDRRGQSRSSSGDQNHRRRAGRRSVRMRGRRDGARGISNTFPGCHADGH